MASQPDRCRHCGATIPSGAAVYGDHNRKFCSESCARSQLDREQGRASVRGGEYVTERASAHPGVSVVGPDRGPARRPGGGPLSR